jgi:aspartate-semialdehyde dehydrogenase
MSKMKVAIVGATGIAGQQFVAALAEHPWFRIARLGASPRSAGKKYGDALRDESTGSLRWWAGGSPPESVLGMTVENGEDLKLDNVDLVFSAVESDVAADLEPLYARTTPVVSTASAFRYEDDVPLLLPGVSLQQVTLLRRQQKNRGWKGFILPQPNCTVTGLAITLKPLDERFGVKKVSMVSMQGISGAGRSPGVAALDAIDNVIPYIPLEEEKVTAEARKLLGKVVAGKLVESSVKVSCTCTRAAVLEGHTEAVSLELERPATPAQAAAALRTAGKRAARLKLPSMPETLIYVHDDPFRPQPRLDRDAGDGMTTSVGRIREEPLYRHGLRYMLVSHNTKMGAAKGALLIAEYLLDRGIL